MGLKLKIHPLFVLFGVFYALTGRVLLFVIYTCSALLHEIGHSIVAGNCGYALNKITLFPFGAVVSGNLDGLKCRDEIKIALAGPITSFMVGIFFVALWWVFPELYAYTDIVAQANLAIGLVNFLPIMPLDGGRVLSATLSLWIKKEKAQKVCKIFGGLLSAVLFALFIYSCFNTLNLSILFFALFVLVGTFEERSKSKYVRIYSGVSTSMMKRGAIIKRIAVDKSMTIKRLISVLDVECLNEVVVFDGKKQIKVLSQDNLSEILQKGELYSPLGKYIT